ncbi:MAG: DUF1376 domain-containing protein [Betaproteobacteria bacterium]|nr:DUF1376 domain-containing protein [Betaproteobacteria bacterium]
MAMNYYEHHLGDYAKDTSHLTMLEHGAYRLLLDRCYGTEQGIPADQAHRVARARTREEKAAVDAILDEFFTLKDGVWVNARAEEEIAKFAAKQPEVEKRRDSDKERQRRARERRKTMFERLLSLGVHMPWNATTDELQEAIIRVTSQQDHASVTSPVTRDNTATRHQTPDTSKPPSTGGGCATVVARDEARPPPPPKADAFPMGLEWEPSPHFATLARQAGLPLPDTPTFEAALTEFRAYWLGQAQRTRTQHEWDHALLKSLRADSLRGGTTTTASARDSPPSRETLRRAAAMTRLSDVMNDDGTPKCEPKELDDERTITVAAEAPRLLGRSDF